MIWLIQGGEKQLSNPIWSWKHDTQLATLERLTRFKSRLWLSPWEMFFFIFIFFAIQSERLVALEVKVTNLWLDLLLQDFYHFHKAEFIFLSLLTRHLFSKAF